ncbi:MAG: Polysaccharide biosynthesis protein, partial [Clostridiales bacterium 38_11]
WNNAYKLGLVSIGAFLITKGNTLIASKYLNLEIVAQYGLTLQIVTMVSTVSSIFFRAYLPKFNSHRMTNDIEGLKRDYGMSLIIFNSVFIIGVSILLLFGNIILYYIGSNTLLLSNSYLFILLLIIFLETNHSNCATLITTKNEVPFVMSSLLSGVGVLLTGLIAVKYLEAGVLGLILAQGFVQLMYNNWKWPKVVFNELNSTYFKIIKVGAVEWIKAIKLNI